MVSRVPVLMGGGSVEYLFDAEFGKDAAAPIGSPFVCDAGSATVTDTGNRLSVAGGSLVVASGAGAWGEPRFVGPAFPRAAATVAVARVVPTSGIEHVGWVSADTATGVGTAGFHVNGATDLRTVNGSLGSSTILIGAGLSAGTAYNLAVVQRATGAWYLVRGGIYAAWTLVYVRDDACLTGGTALPAVHNYSGAFSVDCLSVPLDLWAPAAAANDGFGGTRTGLGTTDGLGASDVPGGAGVAWGTPVTATFGVSGGLAVTTVLPSTPGIAPIDAGTPDVFLQVNTTRAGGAVGVVVRFSDASNYTRVASDGANMTVVQRIAGVDQAAVLTQACGATGQLRVAVYGTKIRVWFANAALGGETTIAAQTGTQVGLYTTSIANTWDALSVYPRGTEGQHESLGRYLA